MSKILFIQTSGLETPERLYLPFLLGITSMAMDVEASIFFAIKGITCMRIGEAEKIKIGGYPSLRDVISQALEAGVKMYVCEQSCQLMGSDGGDFIPGAIIGGAPALVDLALDADTTITV